MISLKIPVSVIVALILALAIYPEQPSKKSILFFLNPYGGPCIRQNSILESAKDSIGKYAQIQYIRTDDNSNMSKFEQWGIRGLPMLIVTDAKGKELHRFFPGVQNSETILSVLRKK